MKTGILFLLLQSAMLCVAVQTGPGVAESLQSDVVNHYLAVCDERSVPDTTDDDAPAPAHFPVWPTFAPAAYTVSFYPARRSVQRGSHGIRAPPALA